MASDAQLPSNEYNERYSRKVPIQLGDLEQFVMAFGVVDDYIEWMRFFKGVDIPGNGPAVIKQLKEARTLALALYNAPPPSETVEVAVDARRYRRLQILGCAVMGTPQLEHGTVSRFSNLDAILDADIAAHPSRGEYAQKAGEQHGS